MRKNRAYCNRSSPFHEQLPNDQSRSPTDHKLFDAHKISLCCSATSCRGSCAVRAEKMLCACAFAEIARCVRHLKTITSFIYHINNGTVLALEGNRTLVRPELLLLCLPTCFVRRRQDAETLDHCCDYPGTFSKVLRLMFLIDPQ